MSTPEPELPESTRNAVAFAIAFHLNPVPWVGGDGVTKHTVATMQTSHIENCIRLIRSNGIRRASPSGPTHQQWLDIFENELTARAYMALHRQNP